MSIDVTTRKIAVMIDGRLECKVKGNANIYGDDDNAAIKALEKRLDAEREKLENCRIEHALKAFKAAIDEFIVETGTMPTLCLMNYRDVNILTHAYNRETTDMIIRGENVDDRPRLDTYSGDDHKRIICGVKVKKGCDQEPGVLQFRSSEKA